MPILVGSPPFWSEKAHPVNQLQRRRRRRRRVALGRYKKRGVLNLWVVREVRGGGKKKKRQREPTLVAVTYLVKLCGAQFVFIFFKKRLRTSALEGRWRKNIIHLFFFSSLLAPGIATSIHASPPSNSLETGKRKLEECVSSGLCKVYSHLN